MIHFKQTVTLPTENSVMHRLECINIFLKPKGSQYVFPNPFIPSSGTVLIQSFDLTLEINQTIDSSTERMLGYSFIGFQCAFTLDVCYHGQLGAIWENRL